MKTLLKLFFFLFLINLTISLHFDLNQENNRCYIEELFKGSVAAIKYKIWSTPENVDKIKEILKNIQITVYNDKNEILQIHTAQKFKDKFSFLSKEEMHYKVCVERTNMYWSHHDPLYVKIKVMSDNMDEPNISKAISTEHVNELKQNVAKIIKRGERLIKIQESELHEEDEAAKKQIQYSSYYYTLALVQVLVVIALGLYQVVSFRKYILDKESMPF